MYKFLRNSYWPAIVWTITIFILLTIPGNDLPTKNWMSKVHVDKWVHFGLFATLVTLWCLPKMSRNSNTTNDLFVWLILAGACAYGIGMEWVQLLFAKNRSYDNYDILLDCIGALAGCLFTLSWVRYHRRKRRNQ